MERRKRRSAQQRQESKWLKMFDIDLSAKAKCPKKCMVKRRRGQYLEYEK